MDFTNVLWGELKTDEERMLFLRSGRAYETGIIAYDLAIEISGVYERLLRREGGGVCECKKQGQ